MSKIKVFLFVTIPLLVILLIGKILSIGGMMNHHKIIPHLELYLILLICVSVIYSINKFIKLDEITILGDKYFKRLTYVLINQSRNSLIYEGDIENGGRELIKEVTNVMKIDRCSIWLYTDDKSSLYCESLYVKAEDKYYEGFVLNRDDYRPYFLALLTKSVIVADNAETNPTTSCFKESYLKPLGIKSMLDVPILFEGECIGVICIESLKQIKWVKNEIVFAELLSSLYSFAYSVRQTNITRKTLTEFEEFVDSSVLVSKANNKGKITYVNKKFTEISGYSLKESLGKDHHIVNSGLHDKKFWKKMYDVTVNKRKIWNNIVINKNKNGEIYWVDTFIKAVFDKETDELKEFISIRQDVTDLYKRMIEINQKNTYLEHAAKIIRHDIHSGINIYIPRGISSLERRLDDETIQRLKLEPPIKMLKEGLKHTQKVYKGVYEFTNMVKNDVVLTKENYNLKDILKNFLDSTAYVSQVKIHDLPTIMVNESLFCTAIDNLIRNGLKYNDSENKYVEIFMEDNSYLCVQDNGRGLTQGEFDKLSQPYSRKENQSESGSGLGLNICVSILKEHGFKAICEKNNIGTKIKIKIV